MARLEKEEVVADLAEKISAVKGLFLTDFTGLNVETIDRLRRNLRSSGTQFQVVKNTLARLAMEKAGHPELCEYLQGPTALAFGYDDPVVPAKILVNFYDEYGRPQIKGCLVGGEVLLPERAVSLARLPDREALLAQVISGVQAPIAGLVMALRGVLSNLVWTLQALLEKRQQGG